MPEHKYRDGLCKFENCPSSTHRQADGRQIAYRFVGGPAISSTDFLPVPALPGRKAKSCGDWAVSVYDSEERAVVAYREARAFGGFADRYPYLAKGTPGPDDGTLSQPDEAGHMDLHEYEGSNLVSTFTVARKL